jgi:HD-like signal output (HDOD) protein
MVRATEEEAFLCGLLHDVGHAIVLHALADFEEQHHQRIARDRAAAITHDYHTGVGQRLAARWGMAARVVDVVARHHETAPAPSAQLALVHAADVLSYGLPEEIEKLRVDPRVGLLGLDAAGIDGLAERRKQVIALARAMT